VQIEYKNFGKRNYYSEKRIIWISRSPKIKALQLDEKVVSRVGIVEGEPKSLYLRGFLAFVC